MKCKTKIFVFLMIVLAGLLWISGNGVCQSSGNGSSILRAAAEHYEQGLFQQVIEDLESSNAQKQIKTDQEKCEKQALLARAYLALDNPDMAQKAIDKLLAINPEYIPTFPQDHDFQKMVTDKKRKLARKKERRKQSYRIIGSVTAVAAAVWYVWPEPKDKPLPNQSGPPPVY